MNSKKIMLGVLLGVALVASWILIGARLIEGQRVAAQSLLPSAHFVSVAAGQLQPVEPSDVFALPPSPVAPSLKDGAQEVVKLNAKSALVVDPLTEAVLYEKNADERLIIASLTKLITGITVADQHPFWAATSTVGVSSAEGRRFYLKGDVVSLRDLLFGSLVGSSNRATYEMVERVKPSPDASFEAKMRLKLQDLGLTRVQIGDSAGLSLDNKASAREIMALYSEALDRPILKEALETGEFKTYTQSGVGRLVDSTNALHHTVPHSFATIGPSKTGYLPESGFHLISTVEDENGRQLWVLVMGAQEHLDRFTEARDLASWAFENYTWAD